MITRSPSRCPICAASLGEPHKNDCAYKLGGMMDTKNFERLKRWATVGDDKDWSYNAGSTEFGVDVLALLARVAELEARTAELTRGLDFYARGEHFTLHDADAWDTVSGEPANFYEDEHNTATVEDGSVAKMALAGRLPADDAGEGAPSPPPQPVVETAAKVLGYVTQAVFDELMNSDKSGFGSLNVHVRGAARNLCTVPIYGHPATPAAQPVPAAVGLTDDEQEAAWEAQKVELQAQYPGIAGGFNVFEVLITTEAGCDPKEHEFGMLIMKAINGAVDRDDYDEVLEAVCEEIGDWTLPEEGQVTVIAYESGEREDVFWSKFYRIASPPASHITGASQ